MAPRWPPGIDLHGRLGRPAGGNGPPALGGLRGGARRRRAAPAHRGGTLRCARGAVVGRDRPLLPRPQRRRLVAGACAGHDAGHVHMVGQAGSLPLLSGRSAPVAPTEPDRGHGPRAVRPACLVTRLPAVLIGGPPAPGKRTLAAALAPHLGAALLDLDVATGPLTRVVSELVGVRDLDDAVLAGLTRAARYDTLLGLAEANLQAGRPVVLVAPFSAERSRSSVWAATTRRIPGDTTMVWLHLPPEELIRRLNGRALTRDENKIRDPASFLADLDLEPPVIPHLALDASQPTSTLVRSVLDPLSRSSPGHSA